MEVKCCAKDERMFEVCAARKQTLMATTYAKQYLDWQLRLSSSSTIRREHNWASGAVSLHTRYLRRMALANPRLSDGDHDARILVPRKESILAALHPSLLDIRPPPEEVLVS